MCVKGRLDIGLERIGSTGLKDKDTTTRFSSYFYFAFRWIWPGSSYSTLAPRGDGDKIKKNAHHSTRVQSSGWLWRNVQASELRSHFWDDRAVDAVSSRWAFLASLICLICNEWFVSCLALASLIRTRTGYAAPVGPPCFSLENGIVDFIET